MIMKKIIRAETLGYCMGVQRAIDLTEKMIQSTTSKPVYTLGPLIHNRSVLDKLKDSGVIQLESPEEYQNGTIIIRTHGVTPEVMERLKRKNADIVDATCTRVIASMRKARSYSEQGYHVVLIGDAQHGEIRAIAGYTKGHTVIQPDGDISNLDVFEKAVIIGQTTLREADYDAICAKIKSRFPDVEIIKSICPVTEQRQEALQRLLQQVDAVIVIGGKNSANTKRLYETAKVKLDTTWLVEDIHDLPEGINQFDCIGITAGASTPDWIIDSIEERIRSLW